ncbi:hypothetical protein [Roseibium sediminicola]|uniref:Uncharacterized protein n=1 Tax=Roseibium sediminicola TaxID=2933272 RepID=A0ABT0H2N3_9HYPH|nr:hypothetical protein [Roseibium sp. CAU 1639]MCK7615947.1 hypothetical protein [Roseibium sp. CAU 1639]
MTFCGYSTSNALALSVPFTFVDEESQPFQTPDNRQVGEHALSAMYFGYLDKNAGGLVQGAVTAQKLPSEAPGFSERLANANPWISSRLSWRLHWRRNRRRSKTCRCFLAQAEPRGAWQF